MTEASPAAYSRHRPCRASDVARWDLQTDVVIVGFGAAGASAAIEAANAGAKVTLFEATSGHGGTSAPSGGEIYMGDRKRVVYGKSGAVRVALGGRRIIQKKLPSSAK